MEPALLLPILGKQAKAIARPHWAFFFLKLAFTKYSIFTKSTSFSMFWAVQTTLRTHDTFSLLQLEWIYGNFVTHRNQCCLSAWKNDINIYIDWSWDIEKAIHYVNTLQQHLVTPYYLLVILLFLKTWQKLYVYYLDELVK